jgi:hypothetical protein
MASPAKFTSSRDGMEERQGCVCRRSDPRYTTLTYLCIGLFHTHQTGAATDDEL